LTHAPKDNAANGEVIEFAFFASSFISPSFWPTNCLEPHAIPDEGNQSYVDGDAHPPVPLHQVRLNYARQRNQQEGLCSVIAAAGCSSVKPSVNYEKK
jgi:hypothetical protein